MLENYDSLNQKMVNLSQENKNISISVRKRKASPIRNLQDIKKIRKILEKTPRDLLLFDLLIQTGIQIISALRLKVKDVSGLAVGDPLPSHKNGGNFTPLIKDVLPISTKVPQDYCRER